MRSHEELPGTQISSQQREELEAAYWHLHTALGALDYLLELGASASGGVHMIDSGTGEELDGLTMAALQQVRQRVFAAGQHLGQALQADQDTSRSRWQMRIRINKAIDKIAQQTGQEPRDIHRKYMKFEGKPQAEMTLAELRAKFDWLYNTWPGFQKDDRDWPVIRDISADAPMIARIDRPRQADQDKEEH